ncbi:MAG: hypothetical protein NUW01_19720 [Gemmatimonadaceae bacterium]|nr:hypothetical protein [Gemmatimonadaceae bacterium]
MNRLESVDRVVGRVHTVVPLFTQCAADLRIAVMARCCDRFEETVADFLDRPEQCAALRSQIEGLMDRLQVISALVLKREGDLIGRV